MLKRLKSWLRRLNEILCARCGTMVNYWAYGYLEFPETWTERFWYNWNIIKGHYSRIGDLPKC